MKKENVLILLKLLEKYNNYIFEQFFINKVFKVYGLKTMIKEELKKLMFEEIMGYRVERKK